MKKYPVFHFLTLMLVGKHFELATASTFNQQENSQINEPPLQRELISPKWDVFADFLAWSASEETSAIWTSVVTGTSSHSTVFEGKGISFDWGFGFRAGLGYNMGYDQWDTQFYWTWFRTQADDQTKNQDQLVLSEFFASFINEDLGTKARIHWTLLLNMLDWELGRSFSISRGFSLRPFIGLKGGWINQKIHSHWDNIRLTIPITDYTSRENLKNHFCGLGPSGGVDSQWTFTRFATNSISLFGDFSTAMLWGTWICRDKYSNSTSKEISVNMRNSSLGALMFRGFLGIGWDTDFNNGQLRLALRLGYEMQFWLNQLRLPTFQQLRLHGDLTLQGGTFDCRFDF